MIFKLKKQLRFRALKKILISYLFSHSAKKKILCSSKLLNYDNRKFLGSQIRDYWLGVVGENSPNNNKI